MRGSVSLDEIEIAYMDAGGEGPAVLLVHGLGGSAGAWEAQLEALAAAGYRAIAHDQRGAGKSSKPPGPYSVELWAEDAERVLDAGGVDRVALVGHSVGTMVAEHLALRLGDRCRALVLIGGALAWPPEARPGFEERARLARDGRIEEIAAAVATTGLSERCRAEDPGLERRFRAMIAANDPDGYAESALATGRGTMRDPGAIGCPTLTLAGELDPVTPPAAAEAIAAAIPGARTEKVAQAAHWCQIEAPREVNAALVDFLAPANAT